MHLIEVDSLDNDHESKPLSALRLQQLIVVIELILLHPLIIIVVD